MSTLIDSRPATGADNQPVQVNFTMDSVTPPDSRYSKTCVKRPLSKRPKVGFQEQLLLNAGQKQCRMLQGDSAILLTFIKLPFVIKIFVFFYFLVAVLHWFYCSNFFC